MVKKETNKNIKIPLVKKGTRWYQKTQHVYSQNQRLFVVIKKREQCLIFNIHIFQTIVFQVCLPQPRLTVAARFRGKFPESRFWQRLLLNLQRIQFQFGFFFRKHIFIPFCHRISWTMFIFPFQVIVYRLFTVRCEEQTYFLSVFSFFPYKILSTWRWSQILRL